MQYLVAKAPADQVAYFIDFSRQLGEGDVIETFAVTITSGTVTLPSAPANFGQFLRAIIAGGADGETADLFVVVNTACGLTFTRTVQVQVEQAATSVTPSTATKAQIVQMAFEETGLPGYGFAQTDAENASALRRLDSLMAMWRTASLDLNYNAPPMIGGGALADQSGIPDDALNAVVTSLAYRISPGIGKTMSTEARVAYAQAMAAVRARYGPKVTRRLPAGTLRGSGAKPWSTWQPYAGAITPADMGGQLAEILVTQNGEDITTQDGQEIGA